MIDTMNQTDSENRDWEPCPQGALSQFAQQHQAHQRRQFLIKTSGIAGGILVTAGIGYVAFREPSVDDLEFGGITCTEVRAKAPRYMAGELDEVLSKKIEIHLEQCPQCPVLMKKMMDDMKQSAGLDLTRETQAVSPQEQVDSPKHGNKSPRSELLHSLNHRSTESHRV